tara:strand:+ start:4377 stop:4523 length:147 start_codon:yes stop_codon:yes gene_type:complete
MWLGLVNTIPTIVNPPGVSSPVVGNFIELEPTLDLVELENSTDLVELE